MNLKIILDSSHKPNDKRKWLTAQNSQKKWLTTLSLDNDSPEQIKIYHSDSGFNVMNRDSI